MQRIINLFESFSGHAPEKLFELPVSGSHRQYFRVDNLIAVEGTSLDENARFIYLARHFREKGINVPEVLAVSEDGYCYLQDDLGTEALFDLVADGRSKGQYSPSEVALLKKAIALLPSLQILGAEGLDWSRTQEPFGSRMVDFDLNYFKYCFLKAKMEDFDEYRLQDDFDRLREDLLSEDLEGFMHRDFQARNIMMRDGEPWVIDFQGGRRGPVYYDLASFVWQARSRFPHALKEELIDTYLESLKQFRQVDKEHFKQRLRLFVLFRMLQVLGCYGFRGCFERKTQFIESIPPALANLRELLEQPFTEYPYLNSLLVTLSQC